MTWWTPGTGNQLYINSTATAASTSDSWLTVSQVGTLATATANGTRFRWLKIPTTTSATTITAHVTWYNDYDDAANDAWPIRRVVTRPNIRRMSRVEEAQRDALYFATAGRAELEWLADQQRRQARELAQKHTDAARDRSLELLLAHLTPAQRKTFTENKWFIVEGGLSKQTYRINVSGHVAANIDVLDVPKVFSGDPLEAAKVTHRLCGHCDINAVPLYDQLLAQKMMLEYDEEQFLKIANVHRRAA